MRRLLMVVLLSLLMLSCKAFVMSVNSRALVDAYDKKKYMLLSGDKDIETDSLEFQEYSKYIKRGLSRKGFIEAKSEADTEIAILLTYGISAPIVNQRSIPIYDNVITGYKTEKSGRLGYSLGDSLNYRERSITTPTYSYEKVGYETVNYNTYLRYLSLTAYDFKEYLKSKKEKQLWNVVVKSKGRNGDLRIIFPVLVAGSYKYYSLDSKSEIKIEVQEDDEYLNYIKGYE